jgi:hypothetical protein
LSLQDLAQTLPGVVLAAVLPGFAVATLIAPRWRAWQRLAMSPGLSAGVIGIGGMAMHDVHIPFEPLTVFPLLVVLGVAAVFRWQRVDHVPDTGTPWWLPIPALIAGLIGAGVFVWALHGQVLPPDWDTPTHAGLVNTIARTHDVLPQVLIPQEATEFVRQRPGFEAMSAVVSWLGAPSPAMSMAPVIALTLALIPLSLTLLAIEATGSVALAAVVPFLALGLAFPADQAIVGRFPEIVDSTLIVPLIVAALRVIRGRNTRDNTLLLLAIVASIWIIHGLEAFTALVIGFGLIAAAAWTAVRASPRLTLIRVALVAAAALAGAVLVTVVQRLPHEAPASVTQPSPIMILSTSTPVLWHNILASIAQTNLTSPIALVLYGIGVVALILRWRMLWVLASQVLLVLLMADDFYSHHLSHFWREIYPWGDTDRILGVQYWLIPLVLGAGLLAAIDLMRSLPRTRRFFLGVAAAAVVVVIVAFLARHQLGHLYTALIGRFVIYIYPLGNFYPLSILRPWIPVVVVAVLAVVAGWVALARGISVPGFVQQRRLGPVARRLDGAVLALGVIAAICVVVGAAADFSVYHNEVLTRSLVTPADLTVMKTMTTTLPKGTVVITDGGDDAGMWLTALTDLTPLVPNGFEYGTLSLPLDVALEDACSNPGFAEEAIARVPATVVFVGAQRMPGALYPWDVSCISSLPDLRLLTAVPWNGTVAAAFEVIK